MCDHLHMPETRTYRPAEAASLLHISPAYLRELAAGGKIIASHSTAGGHRRYSEQDLESARSYLDGAPENQAPPTGQRSLTDVYETAKQLHDERSTETAGELLEIRMEQFFTDISDPERRDLVRYIRQLLEKDLAWIGRLKTYEDKYIRFWHENPERAVYQDHMYSDSSMSRHIGVCGEREDIVAMHEWILQRLGETAGLPIERADDVYGQLRMFLIARFEAALSGKGDEQWQAIKSIERVLERLNTEQCAAVSDRARQDMDAYEQMIAQFEAEVRPRLASFIDQCVRDNAPLPLPMPGAAHRAFRTKQYQQWVDSCDRTQKLADARDRTVKRLYAKARAQTSLEILTMLYTDKDVSLSKQAHSLAYNMRQAEQAHRHATYILQRLEAVHEPVSADRIEQ